MSVLSRIESEILILDGAMGTMIKRAALSESDFRGELFADHPVALKGCYDLLSLTRPELIYNIHLQYLEAGADIISTNSFNSNPISLSGYQLSDWTEQIAEASAIVARRSVDEFSRIHHIASDRQPVVAGCMGPTGVSLTKSMRDSGDPHSEFDKMAVAFCRQAEGLIAGGVDLLLLETVFDASNAKAAIKGIRRAFEKTGKEVPLMISATLTESGQLLSGETIREFVNTVRHGHPVSIGLNCGFGVKSLGTYIKELRSIPETEGCYISFHPNAGHPDESGNYRCTPELMAAEMEKILRTTPVNIIGGCCGTTPDHIRQIARLAK